MMNLAEYRRPNTRLADFLPWAALVDEGIILNKDGSFQRTAKFRGPDLDSAVPAELGGDHDLVAEGRQRLRPILVEDDPLINKSCPRQKIGEPGIGTAVFGEIEHGRPQVLR